MKLSQFTKPLLATAIALSVGTLQVLPASAQTGTTDTAPGTTAPGLVPDATAPNTTTDPTITDTTVDNNDGFDWGWLGLLGLIGLAGLRKQNDDREVYRDPSVDPARTATRTSDYNR
jgi:MYXO-CTERM domain-containing protein